MKHNFGKISVSLGKSWEKLTSLLIPALLTTKRNLHITECVINHACSMRDTNRM